MASGWEKNLDISRSQSICHVGMARAFTTVFQVFAEVVALKEVNPSLRVLLCLGGDFSELVRDPTSVAV